jgi:hypothetical protein
MKTIPRTNVSVISFIFMMMFMMLCQPLAAHSASLITADKDVYNYGDQIKVNFSSAPGVDGDWICLVPVGSPDTEGGDYKYLPVGEKQGTVTFATPSPGKYEIRVFYNYASKGYVVSARYPFTVAGGEAYEKAMAESLARMERKVNTANSLEANLPPGNGLVYIVRETYAANYTVDPQIVSNGKTVVVLTADNYFPFSVPAGENKFSVEGLSSLDIKNNRRQEMFPTFKKGEDATRIKVKAGYVYYIKVAVLFMGTWGSSLEQVSCQDGADLITKYKLTLFK